MDLGNQRTAIAPSTVAGNLPSKDISSKNAPSKGDFTQDAHSGHVSSKNDPLPRQFLKPRGRVMSPRHRVIVYDCEENTVEVKSEEDVLHKDYERLHVPSRTNEVTIFLDSETETKPTIEAADQKGHGNVMVATIRLNKLGFSNSALRFLGQLSTLYVKNLTAFGETTL
ncbi:hypothetical protein MMC22_010740 [Lobaria immixta]|nr:hypothetical protein [Lobaria immixta]